MTHHHNHHRTPQLYEDAKQYIASYLGVQCKPYDECLHTKKVLSIPLINMLSVPKEKQAIAKKFYNASIESEDRGDHRLDKFVIELENVVDDDDDNSADERDGDKRKSSKHPGKYAQAATNKGPPVIVFVILLASFTVCAAATYIQILLAAQ